MRRCATVRTKNSEAPESSQVATAARSLAPPVFLFLLTFLTFLTFLSFLRFLRFLSFLNFLPYHPAQ